MAAVMVSAFSCPSCGEELSLEEVLRERRRRLNERAELIGRVLRLYVHREIGAANPDARLRAVEHHDRIEKVYEALLRELRVVFEMQEALAELAVTADAPSSDYTRRCPRRQRRRG